MIKLQGVLLSLFFIAQAYSFEVVPGRSISDEKIQQVSQSAAWRKLMHYRKGVWGNLRSDVDGADFFFSPEGKTNPLEELKASLKGIYSDKIIGKLKLSVRCSFPERVRFLNEQFGLPAVPVKCEKLDDFMAQFHDPQSISLVFSSAYPNNPASMFGHTFLKVNSARNTDLLDMGVNFAAVVADDENGFAFVWFGTNGGYFGQWSIQPYYVKVREYSNFESRDLWEYKMALSKEETVRLLHHVWELELNSNTEYFFFDENCSYQVLAAVEAVRPEWDLLKHTIYLIPGESVKYLIRQPGSVVDVKYRPSLFNRINSRYRALDKNENTEFHEVLDRKKKVAQVSSRLTAEALITYFDYVKNDRPKFFEKEYAQDLEGIRKQRADLGPVTDDEAKRIPEIKGETRPDLGHDSYSLQTGLGYYASKRSAADTGYLSLKLKSAYHDLINADQGYTPYAHIDFPYIEMRYWEKSKKWKLEELGGISTTSISPVTNLKTPISFRGSVVYKRIELAGEDEAYALHGEIGGGLSYYLISEKNRFYFFAMAATDLSEKLHRGHSLLPGIEMGVLLNPFAQYKVQLLARSFCDLVYSQNCYSQSEYQINHSWSISRNKEFRNTNKFKENSEKRGIRSFESNLNYIMFFN